jgi:hypothetical protein
MRQNYVLLIFKRNYFINSDKDCKLLEVQSDTDSVEEWCIDNFKKSIVLIPNITSLTLKINSMH